jgi:hypothetical protein
MKVFITFLICYYMTGPIQRKMAVLRELRPLTFIRTLPIKNAYYLRR